ncbi:MAG: hypothetical protein IH840_11475 [Candidatus Heimdallarchaeota archaeon]|nr:hypothetical protein [Candidatus Heimdallarchaeota archaeon]
MSKTLDKDEVIEIIVKETKHSREEIDDMIQQTIEMMDNMVNEDGAAYVVANNLGVNISLKQTVDPFKIDQLVPGQSNTSVIGRIKRIYSVRTFNRKDGTEGKVRNIEIADDTGEAKVTLWDNRTQLVEDKDLKLNDIIKVSGASTKIGYNDAIELSLSSHGDFEVLEDKEFKFPEITRAELKTIGELKESNKLVSLEAKIIDRQGIVEFQREKRSGKVTSLTVQDDSGTIRVVFWNEACELAVKFDLGTNVSMTDLRVAKNKFDNLELTFNDFSEIASLSDQSKFSSSETMKDVSIEKIADLESDQQRLSIRGSVIVLGEVKTFSKDNRTNQVANITIMDKSGSVRVSLWGNHATLVSELKLGDIIEISNGSAKISNYSKEIEISCNNKSIIKVLTDLDNEEDYAYPENLRFTEVAAKMVGIKMKVQINRMFEVKDIQRSDGGTGQVLNATVIDVEGNVGRLAAWDTNIAKIENVMEGEALYLQYATIKPGSETYGPEITISNSTTVVVIDAADLFPLVQSADKLQHQSNYVETQLNSLNEGMSTKVTGNIVKAFKPSFYQSCPSCNRKVTADPEATEGVCEEHGTVTINLKMILSIILDDGIDTCMIKLFNKTAEKLLSMNADEASELVKRLSDDLAPFKKQEIEMAEIWIEGKVVRDNNENLQINAQRIGFIEDNQLKKETLSILDKLES